MSARASGPVVTDSRADIYVDGSREVAVWRYPDDPDLPGLSRAAYPEHMAAIISDLDLVGARVSAQQINLRMIGYRPRRRAVLCVEVSNRRFYVKVLRAGTPRLADSRVGAEPHGGRRHRGQPTFSYRIAGMPT